MATVKNLESSFIINEIASLKDAMYCYEKLYNNGSIKCITLKKLLGVKREELNILEKVLLNLQEESKKGI